jgi:hypothetical protein
MPKYDNLSIRLKNRITQGDYVLRGIPAERQLALESGVSYMTARRAVQQLIDEGLLVRGSNGRVEVRREASAPHTTLPVALLSPAYNSPGFDRWRNLLTQAVDSVEGRLRQVLYTHWDDPVILDSLDGFSGVFLLPSSEPMPPAIINHLKQSERPLVILDDNLSYAGVPSIRQFPPVFVQRLLDHLEAQECKKIACLNVQPCHDVIEERIGQWRVWMAAHHFSGPLINNPVESYSQPNSHAYRVMQHLLATKKIEADALFCVTTPAAVGAMRALHEAGLRPGLDIAVCAVDGEGLAEFQIPSLTAVEASDVMPYILTCLKWMAGGGGAWQGPLLMEPSECRLEIRESTTSSQKVSPTVSYRQFAHNGRGESKCTI